ncbi:MAG: undecaprenyl-diphosphate phosphatase [Syntrophomonadaceae bacterium]|nr:undecaprenyl-diphosphate phosphatase [Syntrophomonadaceae bacterium]
MTTLEALLLGAVQGLTEFLPVSSSGHLVIFQHLLGISEPPLTFDILVHIGTLVAVFIAFRDDIITILRKPFSRFTYLLIVACIPAALAGYLLAPIFEASFSSLLVVGIGLLITGTLLKLSENLANRNIIAKEVPETRYRDAIFIGILQAFAIFPGVSRSGSTIAAGLIAGLDRNFAAHFSFVLSIPVIMGAAVFQLKDAFSSGIPQQLIIPYLLGPIMAAIFGYVAITVVLDLVRKGKLSVFSYYCWALGAIVLVWNYFI